ncbi:unnamed protein product [Trichogramma brassicae]|uniref:CCHC-type domain-containing protein n=1 Tax=Trichogramma brassicae TaxID=86971 RepID=A0A6H5IQW1_9HYME|nr:unnamed protein product [Trichogramma brassicae]
MEWVKTIPRERSNEFAKQTLWQREVKLSGSQRRKLAPYRGSEPVPVDKVAPPGPKAPTGAQKSKTPPKEGTPVPRGQKRRKGSGNTPPVGAPASRRRCTDEGISAARVADPLTRAIVADNYPDDPITRTLWLLRRGAAIVVAKNVFSRDWMKGIVPKLSPWKGAKLKVVSLEALKRPHKAMITVPGRLDSKTIFQRIERVCPGQGTGQWRVYSEVPAKEGQDLITTLVLSRPESSERKLRERDFTIAWGLGRVRMKVDDKDTEPSETVDKTDEYLGHCEHTSIESTCCVPGLCRTIFVKRYFRLGRSCESKRDSSYRLGRVRPNHASVSASREKASTVFRRNGQIARSAITRHLIGTRVGLALSSLAATPRPWWAGEHASIHDGPAEGQRDKAVFPTVWSAGPACQGSSHGAGQESATQASQFPASLVPPIELQQRRKRPASSLPGISRMLKRCSGSISPAQFKVNENNNNDPSRRNAKSDFIEVKSRGVLRHEKETHGQPTTRPGQRHVQMQSLSERPTVQLRHMQISCISSTRNRVDTVSKKVESIRYIASGALVLRLSKGVHDVSALTMELGGVLGNVATASALRHTTSIEVRDLDESTTAKEDRRALGTQLSSSRLELIVIKSLHKAYAGTMTAVVAFPDDLAAQSIKLGHLRVRWVSCRIRDCIEATRCYRCWTPGHVAFRCKGPDRTALCYCCAQEGHRAKHRENLPSCIFCRGRGTEEHASTSLSCPRVLILLIIIYYLAMMLMKSNQSRQLSPCISPMMTIELLFVARVALRLPPSNRQSRPKRQKLVVNNLQFFLEEKLDVAAGSNDDVDEAPPPQLGESDPSEHGLRDTGHSRLYLATLETGQDLTNILDPAVVKMGAEYVRTSECEHEVVMAHWRVIAAQIRGHFCAPGTATPTAPGSGTPSVVGSKTHSEVESERSARQLSLAEHLKRLNEKITEMMDFAMPRNNVHKPIKEGLTKALLILQSCYTALDGLEHLPCQNTVEKEVQTLPRPGIQKTPKTAQKTTLKSSNIPPPPDKRSKRSREKDAAKDPKSESSGTADWQQVQRKRHDKKVTPAKAKAPDPKAKVKPAGRPRIGVVIVKAKDPKSYAEILKLLRSEPTLQDLVSSVNKVRRSAGCTSTRLAQALTSLDVNWTALLGS